MLINHLNYKGHMSNETEIKEKNRELELERALKFWEMQELIKFQLRNYLLLLMQCVTRRKLMRFVIY